MHEVKILEEKWISYHKKKRRPYVIGVSLLALFGFIIIAYVYTNKNNMIGSFNTQQKVDNATHENVSAETNQKLVLTSNNQEQTFTVVLNRAMTTIEAEKSEVSKEVELLVPTLPVINEIPMAEENEVYASAPKNNSAKVKPSYEKVKTSQKTKPNKIHFDKPRKRKHLNIVETSSKHAYGDVEKRFNKTHNPHDSLFLAKSYYSNGDYKKAEHWALETNKIDKNIEESWIVFVKSKVKLGQKGEALKVLTQYISQSNSDVAKQLLYTLKNK
ncbi:MAG: CDC27 family protein [Campylobacterota bacterium]|nr:CDC27 family protein [Campylobacterota bacterium]